MAILVLKQLINEQRIIAFRDYIFLASYYSSVTEQSAYHVRLLERDRLDL